MQHSTVKIPLIWVWLTLTFNFISIILKPIFWLIERPFLFCQSKILMSSLSIRVNTKTIFNCTQMHLSCHLRGAPTSIWGGQGWGKYYLGTRLVQNDKPEYTKTIVLEYFSGIDFPVLVLVCSVLTPALVRALTSNVSIIWYCILIFAAEGISPFNVALVFENIQTFPLLTQFLYLHQSSIT